MYVGKKIVILFCFPLLLPSPRWSWTASLTTRPVVFVGITMEFQSTMSLSVEVSHHTTLTVIPKDGIISIVYRSITREQILPLISLYLSQSKHYITVLHSWSKPALFQVHHLFLFSAGLLFLLPV